MSLVLNNELVNLLNLIEKDNKLLNDYFGKSIEVIESGKLEGIQGSEYKSFLINPDEIFEAILVGAGGDGSGVPPDSTSTGGGGGAVVHLKIYKPDYCQLSLGAAIPGVFSSSLALIVFYNQPAIRIKANNGYPGNHNGIPGEGGSFLIERFNLVSFRSTPISYLEILQNYPNVRIIKAIRGGRGGTWTTPAESVCDVIHLINRDFKIYSQGGDFRGGGASLFGGGGPFGYNGDSYGGGGGAAWSSGTQGGIGGIIYFRYREI
jgi:hypothetical protein